jgi:hypothetical protein
MANVVHIHPNTIDKDNLEAWLDSISFNATLDGHLIFITDKVIYVIISS